MVHRLILILGLFTVSFLSFGQEGARYLECAQYIERASSHYSQGLYGQARAAAHRVLSDPSCGMTSPVQEARLRSIYLRAGLDLDLPQAINQSTQYIKEMYPSPYITDLIIHTADYFYTSHQYGEAIEYYGMVDLDALPEKTLARVALHKGYAHFVLKEFTPASLAFSYARDIEGLYFEKTNYYHGMTRYFMEDYDAAIKSFRRIQNSSTYGSHIPYYICQIYYKQGAYVQLLKYGEKAIQNKEVESVKDIRHLLGQIYFKEGAYADALPHLEYYEQHTESLTQEAFYQLAFAQYQHKMYADASKNFMELSGLKSQLGQVANYYLADCLEKLGDKDSARAAFKKVSQMTYSKEMQEEASFNYGKLSIEQGHDREALQILTSLSYDSPYYAESQGLINDVLKSSSDYEHAVAIIEKLPSRSTDLEHTYQQLAFKRAIQAYIDKDTETTLAWLDKSNTYALDPSIVAQGHFWRARIAANEGNYTQSIGHFQNYFAVADSGIQLPMETSIPIAYYYQAYNNIKLKEYKEASIGYAQSSTRLDKQYQSSKDPKIKSMYTDATLRLADCYFMINDYKKALYYYDAVGDPKSSTYPYTLYQKATLLGLQNKSYDKIVTLEKIRNRYPTSEYADDALLELGNVYLQQNKPAPALLNYQKLIQDYGDRSPLVQEAILKTGLIRYNQGDYASALALYKKVLKLNPSPDQSQEAIRAIEEIYVNELGKTQEYITYADSIPGINIDAYAQDSLQYRAAESQYTYGNYGKAIELFTSYLIDNPQGSHAIPSYFTRGEAYAAKKDYEKALSDYRQVVGRGVSTYYERALYKAALISYNHTQDFATSYNLNNTLSNYTQDKKLQNLARIYALQSAFRTQNTVGIEKHAQLLLGNPDTAESDRMAAYYYLGKTMYGQSKYTEAIAALEPLAASPKSTNQRAEAAYLLAKIAYDRKKYSEAERLANEANKRSKNYPSWIARSLLLLSDIYIQQDKLLNARAAIEAVVDNFTSDPKILADAKSRLAQLVLLEEKNNRIKSSHSTDTLELKK